MRLQTVMVTREKSRLLPWVKFIYLVLLANALPAFVILIGFPGQTDQWFVWTIKPDASARLLGVMYFNAILLVISGFFEPSWEKTRIKFVAITFFSCAATIVTFFNLEPFLKHPWYHLAYWLSMYLILFVAAPLVFLFQELKNGGKLEIKLPLSHLARLVASFAMIVCGISGLGLFIDPAFVTQFWPWMLTPLVGRILAVWFFSQALAYAWALWDGDRVRTRPIFWQAIPTGLLLALIPLLNGDDIGKNRGASPLLESTPALVLYLVLALVMALLALLVLLEPKPEPTFR